MKLRDRILQADDIPERVLFVDAWKCSVLIRGLTADQRASLLQSSVTAHGAVDFSKVYPNLLIQTVYDPKTSKPLFDQGDVAALLAKSGSAVESVAQVAMRLSGLAPSQDDPEIKRLAKQLAKKSTKKAPPRKKAGRV